MRTAFARLRRFRPLLRERPRPPSRPRRWLPTLSHPLRLGLSLVLLSASVLLLADALGLRGDVRETLRESRKTVAESLAVQLSSLASIDDVGGIQYSVSAFVLRSDDVLAAALVRANGIVVARHGDADALVDVEDRSSLARISVPILEDASRWGELRIVFAPTDDARRELAWLGFVVVASLASFVAFLSKVLVQLDPGRAVPGRVDSAFNLFSAGVVILDERLRIVMANRSAAALIGRAPEELTGRTLDEWPWEDGIGAPRTASPWRLALDSGQAISDERLRLRVGDAELDGDAGTRALTVSCSVVGDAAADSSPDEGGEGVRGVLVTFDDETRTERQNAELADANTRLAALNAELDLLATTDPLTGAANRRVLMERLESALEAARRDGTPLACVMCDIDHFKRVNDTFGHGVGDEVIVAVAKVLTRTGDRTRSKGVEGGDAEPMSESGAEAATLGRYGGEEFVLVLPGHDAAAAVVAAEALRAEVRDLPGHEGLPVPRLSASFGVADLACGPADGSELLDAADRALYVAKDTGRDRVVTHGTACAAPVPTPTPMPAATLALSSPSTPASPPTSPPTSPPASPPVSSPVSSLTPTPAPTAVPGSSPPGPTPEARQASGATLDAGHRAALARVEELETLLRRRERDVGAARRLDALTGAPVRAPFLERAAVEIARGARAGTLVGALSVELRELERIVSTFGHAATDALVVDFVRRVEGGLRSTDLVLGIAAGHSVSRIASNEFGVLLADLADAASALVVVARLRRLLVEPFELGGERVWVGANIGIALSTPTAEPAADVAAELLAQAGDARVAAAARPDKVAHAFASAELDARARDYIRLETDLRGALERDELEVHFQPKLDLATDSVTGMEALVRWNHPERGAVSPALFVAVAEANGLVEALSDFVLRSVLGRIATWRELGFDELRVSVNVSPIQLRSATLVADVLRALKVAGVAGRQLEIELTETSVFERIDEARTALEALRAAEVSVSMDDFGTGYTSLGLLADLPLDALKIDRSFIVAMETSARSRAVVASTVDMAHALGLRVVGEGVETAAQLERLAGMGCDEVQGYLVARPLPFDEITAFLLHRRERGDGAPGRRRAA